MKANYLFSIVSISSLACIQAGSVTFRVIAPGSTDVKVSINGQQSQLTQQDPNIPYFIGQAELSNDAKYKVSSKIVPVSSLFDNFDFFGYKTVRRWRHRRAIRSYSGQGTQQHPQRFLQSVCHLCQHPRASLAHQRQGMFCSINIWVYIFLAFPMAATDVTDTMSYCPSPQPQWTRGGSQAAIFDTNYIPSIFIVGDKAEMDNLVKNVPADLYNVQFTIITAEDVQTFNVCCSRRTRQWAVKWKIPIYYYSYRIAHSEFTELARSTTMQSRVGSGAFPKANIWLIATISS